MTKSGKEELPRVFGLGLSRTGTTSLGEGLNLLGIRTVHYPYDERTLEELTKENYELSVLREYRGLVDIVASPYYAQFDEIYPESKFVLTVRDETSWLRSLRDHWNRMTWFSERDAQFKRFNQFLCARVYGTQEFNEDRMRGVYKGHLKSVCEYFEGRPEDLLIMDICDGEGWEKLCPFLGLPVPGTPFAHVNKGSGKQGDHLWAGQVAQAATEIARVIPADEIFILVDEATLASELTLRTNPLPFLENEGHYWGRPAEDQTAIRELERLRGQSAKFLVFFSVTFWWLEYYAGFHRYLRANFRCIFESECLVVFDLRT